MEIKTYIQTDTNYAELMDKIGMRKKMEMPDVVSTVQDILDAVRRQGDQAVLSYTEKFDKVKLDARNLRVRPEEIENAIKNIDKGLLAAMKKSCENVMAFHQAQLENMGDLKLDKGKGSYVALLNRPLDTVGVYVPGGTAPLPSSVIMNVAPAKAAGVRRIVMCTPPTRDGSIEPVILAAASIIGVDEIYRVGGAQAIAAMAYGTESIGGVDKICGPGNIYVNTAKRLVFGTVDIDMFAGPSEILILADKTARPVNLAMDLLSQAEHDKLASAILLTDSKEIAQETSRLVKELAPKMPRASILEESLPSHCAIVLMPDIDKMVDFANELAPEHLEVCCENPEAILPKIRNAGAVFLGNYSPESLGDYFAGPNHVLPTSGTARFFSPLNTADFMKKISVINYSRESLEESYRDIALFARSEELECHARAVEVRFEE